jgi:hypothetical protein
MAVVITGARVQLGDGTVVARIERVGIGGGIRTRTVDGVPVDEQQPLFERFHVRLLSPVGPLAPDELVEAATYEDACAAGEEYAAKVAANAGKIADLAGALKR